MRNERRTQIYLFGMREKLAEVNGNRGTYRGRFERLGQKRGWKGRTETTVLLIDITDILGNPVCDHLWFNLTKQFESLHLEPGELVEFQARVKPYLKGYRGRREDPDLPPVEKDYKLSHPTQVKKLQPPRPSSLPTPDDLPTTGQQLTFFDL